MKRNVRPAFLLKTLRQKLERHYAVVSAGEKRLRLWVGVLQAAFIAATFLKVLMTRDYSNIKICLMTLFAVQIPAAVEILLHCKMHPALYVTGSVYALGPMLGDCYRLFYRTVWFDKALHTLGGVLFALIGAFIMQMLLGSDKNRKAIALFAFCFSIAVSALWEIAEFAGDSLFDMDEQNDNIVYSIHSHLLAGETGATVHIEGIQETSLNSGEKTLRGYLDIGLIDTMRDIIVETLGALGAANAVFFSKERLSMCTPLEYGA